ncbi:MAG: sigma-E processing peptidase SpoIIGA [Candidatus Fournierella pullistercoris]|uniref:Sigma-E processing peptidase SpoIIGA n=1 Tax=Candidatus Allofournierella pullistercoris TaxID=2838597 RepID=A0A948T1J9_9FIRM|nr:sigma-E processing peptidase SpoIIGA [Candidatus Fournierella pullistercoris]
MKTVIYLDVLLIVNFLIAYLLLRATSLLCASPARASRCMGGAALAALFTLSLLAPTMPLLLGILYKAGTAFAVCRIAFGFRSWRLSLQQMFCFFVLNLLLAGGVLWAAENAPISGMQSNNFSVYLPLSPTLIVACAAGVYLVLRVFVWLFGRPSSHQRMLTLQLHTPPYSPILVQALVDSGFLLQDPLTGKPALMIHYPYGKGLIPPDLQPFVQDFLQGGNAVPPADCKLRLIPCATATGTRTLPALEGVQLETVDDHCLASATPMLVVFTDQPLSAGQFQALIGEGLL